MTFQQSTECQTILPDDMTPRDVKDALYAQSAGVATATGNPKPHSPPPLL